MGIRGRTSSAALSLVNAEQMPRSPPPEKLSDEETAEWWSIVNGMPAEWFPRETLPLLVQLVRHVVTSRRLAQLKAKLEADEEFDMRAYDSCLKMMARESMCIANLMTRCRLAQSARERHDRAPKSRATVKPWE